MKFLKNNKGFTLVEMISVILVLGIISAVAVPMFDNSTINATLVANTVQTDIQYTQELAMTRNQDIAISFGAGATSYSLPTDPSGVWPADSRALPQGVTIQDAVSISFNKHGEISSGGATVTLIANGIQSTVTVQGITGRATVP
jgi:prepilin-type N-terminal cleavage/methylation domain-containing protein